MAQRIQSASRALNILAEVAASDRGLTAAELREQLGLSKPTTYHLINTLTDARFLYKEGGRFVLGTAAGAVADGFARQTEPAYLIRRVEELAQSTGESAAISVRRGAELIISHRARGSSAVVVYENMLGEMLHPHARASGKVLLAYAPSGIREHHLSRPLAKCTPSTITGKAALERELERVRHHGYALDLGEYSRDVACVAAPAVDSTFYAISISVPITRFDARKNELIEVLCGNGSQ